MLFLLRITGDNVPTAHKIAARHPFGTFILHLGKFHGTFPAGNNPGVCLQYLSWLPRFLSPQFCVINLQPFFPRRWYEHKAIPKARDWLCTSHTDFEKMRGESSLVSIAHGCKTPSCG